MTTWDDLWNIWPVRMAKSAYDAAKLPGDVYSGNVPMAMPGLRREDFTDTPGSAQPNDAAIGRAADLAGLVSAGAGGFPVGENALKAGFEISHFGVPVKIYENLSPKEIAGLISRTKHNAVRVLDSPETATKYYWDADLPALHKNVADQLGVPFERSRAYMLGD